MKKIINILKAVLVFFALISVSLAFSINAEELIDNEDTNEEETKEPIEEEVKDPNLDLENFGYNEYINVAQIKEDITLTWYYDYKGDDLNQGVVIYYLFSNETEVGIAQSYRDNQDYLQIVFADKSIKYFKYASTDEEDISIDYYDYLEEYDGQPGFPMLKYNELWKDVQSAVEESQIVNTILTILLSFLSSGGFFVILRMLFSKSINAFKSRNKEALDTNKILKEEYEERLAKLQKLEEEYNTRFDNFEKKVNELCNIVTQKINLDEETKAKADKIFKELIDKNGE